MRRNFRYTPQVLCLGPLALFLPGLLRGDALYWGTPMLQFIPWREFAFELIRNGHMPFWNPLSGMKAPLLANYQTAVFYPPHWMLLLIPVAWGQGLLVLLHLIWSAFGVRRLSSEIGGSPLAQVLSALAYSLSGYILARAGFLSITVAAAWLPWIICGAERLTAAWVREEGSRGGAVLFLGVMLAMQWLSGHAQTAWYCLVLLVAWVFWRAGFRRRAQIFSAVKGVFLAGLLGFLLSAVQLLPTLEYLFHSARAASLDEVFALTYSFWPWRLTGLIAPDLFGHPARGGYWGYANYYEDSIYIGLIPLFLAVHAIRRGWMRAGEQRSLIRFLSIVIAVSFLFALGWNTPVFPFLFRNIPTFDLFQAPTRWNLLVVFALSLLAGLGVDRWSPPTGHGLYWTRLGTAGAAIIGVAAFFGGVIIGDVNQTFIRAFALAGLWIFAAGILSLTKREPISGMWSGAVSVIVLFDLVLAGTALNPMIPSGVYQGRTALSRQVSDGHRLYMDAELEYQLKFEQIFRFDTFEAGLESMQLRETGLANVQMLDRIPAVNNFDPLLPDRYATWMSVLAEQDHTVEAVMLQLMDAGWRAEANANRSFGVAYRRIPAAARVRVVPNAVGVESGDSALALVQTAGFDPDEIVYLEGISNSNLPAGGAGQAELEAGMNPNLVSVHVDAEAGGWLVLSDTYYPGWQATMDGELVEIFPADYLFMGVWVPEGEHDVSFRYESPLFWIGCSLSILGAVTVVGLGIAWRRD